LKIDLHIHTAIASPCSSLSIPQLFAGVKSRGLDGVCITDHGTYAGYHKVKRAAQDLMPDLKVFFGVEIKTSEGDMLVYSEQELPESVITSESAAQELIDVVHEAGGLAVAAHPFRRNAPSLGPVLHMLHGLDGIEVRNGNCPDFMNEMALKSAMELNLFFTSSSDAHSAASVGAYYSVFDKPVTNQKELVTALVRGLAKPSGDGMPLRGVR
jgi:hypothetical protein